MFAFPQYWLRRFCLNLYFNTRLLSTGSLKCLLIIFDWIESICFMWIWEAREYWSCKSLRTFMSFLYIDLSRKGKQKEKNVSNKKSATSTEHLNGKCIQHDQPIFLNIKRNFLIMGLFCCQIQLTLHREIVWHVGPSINKRTCDLVCQPFNQNARKIAKVFNHLLKCQR